MNKKSKIIVSIVGITIVLLTLIGLTYAFFLTKITGNDNPNSVVITTANLELVYGDGNGMLLPSGVIEPSSDSIKFYVSNQETTDPTDVLLDNNGNPIIQENKTFTVTNKGEDSSYVVIIDETETKYANNGSYTNKNNQTITYNKGDSTEFVTNGFRYSLSCVVKDKSGNVLDEKCYGSDTKSVFPINGGILVGNAIEKDKAHEYTLTMWFIDTDNDQSEDMNKTYQARVNIADINQMENPYKTGNTENDKVSLAYNIIENAKLNKNGTRLVNTPPTKVAEEYSSNNWDLGKEENVYYDDKYIVEYAASEDALSRCEEGYLNEDKTHFEFDCDDLKEYTNCTDDVIGKYVFGRDETGIQISQYVLDCEDGKIVIKKHKYEKVLATTQDDYGTSYYFRGNVEDNYVNFAGMCWRIVRIEGDGSVKLTLESQSSCSENMTSDFSIGETSWEYKIENSQYSGDNNNSTSVMKNLLNTWFDDNFKSNGNLTNSGLKLKDEKWCLGNTTDTYNYNIPYELLDTTALENYSANKAFYYETGRNLLGKGVIPNATLKCNGETDLSKIGMLTADEVVFAGGKTNNLDINSKFYLQNQDYYWWTLSRSVYFEGTDDTFYVNIYGNLYADNTVLNTYDIRPSVSLKPGSVILRGKGTLESPYEIG